MQHQSKHQKFAELLDSRFSIPGTNIKFGIDPVLGLVTGVGDWFGAAFSMYFLIYATRLGAKKSVLIRMFLNIVVDLMVGFIPLLGDVFDIGWKANLRNADILDELEQNPEKLEQKSRWLLWLLLIVFIVIIAGIFVLIGWILTKLLQLIFN